MVCHRQLVETYSLQTTIRHTVQRVALPIPSPAIIIRRRKDNIYGVKLE